MARLIVDMKEEVKDTIIKYAHLKKKSIKEVVFEALSIHMLNDIDALLKKEFRKNKC